jgi:hypothetical protein
MRVERQTVLHVAGIPVEVHRKKIKHLHLYVKPPSGHALATAPARMTDAAILAFLETKADWLTKHVAKFTGRPAAAPAEYADGETLWVWGVPYALQTVPGSRYALTLSGTEALFTVRPGSTKEQRAKFVIAWYRGLLTAEIARRLPAWELTTGLHAAAWQTRDMKTRWGTCNTKTKKLWFSVQLAKKPPACLDYVLLHELLHLLERGHNARFYGLLDRYMLGWREVRAGLNGNHVSNTFTG